MYISLREKRLLANVNKKNPLFSISKQKHTLPQILSNEILLT